MGAMRAWAAAAMLGLAACGGSAASLDGPGPESGSGGIGALGVDGGHCGSIAVCNGETDRAATVFQKGGATGLLCGYPVADAGANCAVIGGSTTACQPATPGARCVPGYQCIVAYADGTTLSGVCQ